MTLRNATPASFLGITLLSGATLPQPKPQKPASQTHTAKTSDSTKSAQWIIKPGVSAGAITARSTLEDLIRAYGKENVSEKEVYVGEGMAEPGVVIFASDPARPVEVVWKDAKPERTPSFAVIRGEKSLWQTSNGIKLRRRTSLSACPASMADGVSETCSVLTRCLRYTTAADGASICPSVRILANDRL